MWFIHNDLDKSDWIVHHGIEGQRWGIQNGPPYPLGSGQDDNDSANIDVDRFTYDTSDFPTIPKDEISPSEYAHVISEVNTWMTKEQRGKPSFLKAVGDYIYTIINDEDGPRIIDREEIPDSNTGLYERRRYEP